MIDCPAAVSLSARGAGGVVVQATTIAAATKQPNRGARLGLRRAGKNPTASVKA